MESDMISMQDIFAFEQTGIDANHKTAGYFCGRGFVPEFYEQLASIGIPLDLSIFDDGAQNSGLNAQRSRA